MKKEIIRSEVADNQHNKFYTIIELATLLSVHANTVAKMIKERKITAIKVAGVWRISQVALDTYLNSRTVKAAV